MLPPEPFRERLLGWLQTRSKQAVIVSTGGVEFTGGALLAVIADAHRCLEAQGFRPGHRIASPLARGPEAAVAALAAGSYCSFVPLEIGFDLVKPAAVLGDLNFEGLGPPEAPENALAGERFLCKTSGTVRPKYVPKTGVGICASMDRIGAVIPIGPEDRCAATVPAYYSLGLVSNILLPVLTGGIVVYSEGPAGLFDACENHGVTWMATAPATLFDLIRYAQDRGLRLRRPLRFIRTAGAVVTPDLAAAALEVFGAPVLSSYGSTEVPVIATVRLGDPPALRHSGRVCAGVSIRFDAGEVLATSECTATTYWNDPEASRAAFERDASGRVWYRTGDLGYLDSDGNLHLTGRKTDLINRGGLKVAPWEVEEVLLRHPLVAEAVAFKVPDERLGEEVVAAVTLREGSVSEGDLRSFASRLLPVEKTPRRVFVVDAIPRNEMGKPLRAKLTERFSGLDRQVLGGKPEDELELGLIRICEDVLGIDGAGVNDNFFDLGGNSASAVEFLARVAKEYRFDAVTPAVLFEANSFALLAELLRRGDAAPQPVVALRAEGEGVPLVIVCVDPESYASPWRTLVRELPGDRPVYLLKPSLEGAETFAEMARVLVSSLQEVLPHGPYALAGTCLMAALAHEMTVQLEARGERVSAVFGIDTWFPYADRRLRAPGYFHPLRLAGVWREAGGLTGFLRRGALSMRNRLQLRPVRPIDEEIERAKAACRRHTATPIDARVVTIWSRHVEAITGHTPEQLWGGVAKHGLVIERFACDRFAMLAGAMNRELAELVEAHLRHPLALSVGACDSKPRSIEATAC